MRWLLHAPLLLWASLQALGAAPPTLAQQEACSLCEWLSLPLDDWTQSNETVTEELPWGQVIELPPVDYRRLGEELCECSLDAADPSGAPRSCACCSAVPSPLPETRVKAWQPDVCVCAGVDFAPGDGGAPFIRVNGMQFFVNGDPAPFYFTGFNAAQALSWAASNDSAFLGGLDQLFASAEGTLTVAAAAVAARTSCLLQALLSM